MYLSSTNEKYMPGFSLEVSKVSECFWNDCVKKCASVNRVCHVYVSVTGYSNPVGTLGWGTTLINPWSKSANSGQDPNVGCCDDVSGPKYCFDNEWPLATAYHRLVILSFFDNCNLRRCKQNNCNISALLVYSVAGWHLFYCASGWLGLTSLILLILDNIPPNTVLQTAAFFYQQMVCLLI